MRHSTTGALRRRDAGEVGEKVVLCREGGPAARACSFWVVGGKALISRGFSYGLLWEERGGRGGRDSVLGKREEREGREREGGTTLICPSGSGRRRWPSLSPYGLCLGSRLRGPRRLFGSQVARAWFG